MGKKKREEGQHEKEKIEREKERKKDTKRDKDCVHARAHAFVSAYLCQK